jgi:hypothetical protein
MDLFIKQEHFQGTQVVSWNFGDPASGTANEANGIQTNHLFSQPGFYNIRAMVPTPCGTDTFFFVKLEIVDCGKSCKGSIDFPNDSCVQNRFSFRITSSNGVQGAVWDFGDPGSGYDLGRRAVSKAILELQGWQLPTRLSTLVRDHTGLTTAAEVTRHFYQHAEPNKQIAALAPALLRLAAEGDHAAHQVVAESVTALLQIAEDVITKLFPGWHRDLLRTGVTGTILTHAAVRPLLATRSSLQLRTITEPPMEGVRRLLLRTGA